VYVKSILVGCCNVTFLFSSASRTVGIDISDHGHELMSQLRLSLTLTLSHNTHKRSPELGTPNPTEEYNLDMAQWNRPQIESAPSLSITSIYKLNHSSTKCTDSK